MLSSLLYICQTFINFFAFIIKLFFSGSIISLYLASIKVNLSDYVLPTSLIKFLRTYPSLLKSVYILIAYLVMKFIVWIKPTSFIASIFSEIYELSFYTVYLFQDPASVYSYSLITLHHVICYYLIIILCLVYYLLYKILVEFQWKSGVVVKTRNLSVWSISLYLIKNTIITLESYITYIFFRVLYLIKMYISYLTNFYNFKSAKNIITFQESFLLKQDLFNLNSSLDEFLMTKKGYKLFEDENNLFTNNLLTDLIIKDNNNYLHNLKTIKDIKETEDRGYLVWGDIFRNKNVHKTLKYYLDEKYFFNYLQNSYNNGVFNANILNLNELLSFKFNSLQAYNFLGSYEETFKVNSKTKTLRDINFSSQNFKHKFEFEVVWALFPSAIIATILAPSFKLLYSLQEVIEPWFTFMVVGNQWYWDYQFYGWLPIIEKTEQNDLYSYLLFKDINNISQIKVESNYSSNIIMTDDLIKGEKRLLQVDESLLVPSGVSLRFLITASDVLHAWAVPSLGIKCDAVPGRLNQSLSFISHPGTYYGQCSELCGVSHGFMPIMIQAVPLTEFLNTAADFYNNK